MFFALKGYSSKRYWQQEGLQHALTKADRSEWSRSHEAYVVEITSRLKRGMRVVELGCSGGHWFDRLGLHERGCDYTGVEWNSDSIVFARRKHPQAEFHRFDIAKASDLNRFDYVLACQVLLFLDPSALERVLRFQPGALVTIREPSTYDIDFLCFFKAKT